LLEIVQQIGAAAGTAAFVGLAALSSLHLSQARDVKRLREWAGRAPERARQTAAPITAIALVGLLVLGGAAAYGVTQVIDDSSGAPRASNGNGARSKPKRKAAAINPGTVTVAVLNGTTVPGLAAALSDRLAAGGFTKGTINNYSDQQLAESVVQYAPGHQAEANEVRRRLGISRREPIAADSRALAGDATVIVIAGTDKAP
jgi:hypothetical protein